MCDYSLHSINNRLAVEGEDLVVHRFITGSIGLTEPSVATRPMAAGAVCIPPGARLALTGISEYIQQEIGVAPRRGSDLHPAHR